MENAARVIGFLLMCFITAVHLTWFTWPNPEAELAEEGREPFGPNFFRGHENSMVFREGGAVVLLGPKVFGMPVVVEGGSDPLIEANAKITFGREGGRVPFGPDISRVEEDPEVVIVKKGGQVAFLTRSMFGPDDYLLYRVLGDADLLLVNCSQQSGPQPEGYDVKCDLRTKMPVFSMHNTTLSHSGDYRAEGWKGGNITERRSFRLIVCAEVNSDTEQKKIFLGDNVELCRLKSTLGHNSSLQLYQPNQETVFNVDSARAKMSLVLDTNISLKPLAVNMRDRLHVDVNTSLVTLSRVTEADVLFFCTIWRGSQCRACTNSMLLAFPKMFYAHEGENLTLPCILKAELPQQVQWFRQRHWQANGDDRLIINKTHPQEMMYMVNGSQTGDYSLVIPSVSRQQSGSYTCATLQKMEQVFLFVCNKFSPLEVMFSQGENVLLDMTEHWNNSWHLEGTQWYLQKIPEPQVLIVDVYHMQGSVNIPEGQRDRVIVSISTSNSSLTIFNVTAEDSGLYMWRLHGSLINGSTAYDMVCSEGMFRLVHRDPFGVNSLFYTTYAPLIVCVLLGLVAAVIWSNLRRSSGGEQTSGHQSRDEDLYDDVEMVELNMPLSAVCPAAAEHSD